jgi:hypothetical protein
LSQTEQFIETLFPQQDPTKMARDGKPAELTEQPGMQASEAFFLLAAVMGVLFLVGGLMVSFAPLPRTSMLHAPCSICRRCALGVLWITTDTFYLFSTPDWICLASRSKIRPSIP